MSNSGMGSPNIELIEAKLNALAAFCMLISLHPKIDITSYPVMVRNLESLMEGFPEAAEEILKHAENPEEPPVGH